MPYNWQRIGLGHGAEWEIDGFLPKASSREHLEANMNIYDFELEDEDFYAIDDLDKDQRFIDPDFSPVELIP